MKMVLIFLVAVTTISITAFADDECSADVSVYSEAKLKTRKPIFAPRAKNVDKILPTKLKKYSFEDSMLLKDGAEVLFSVGGCAHYSYSFTFSGKAIKIINDSKKVARAKTLLTNLEVTNKIEKTMLLEAINKSLKDKSAKFKDGTISLPCGDANCALNDRDDGKVVVYYDFAL